MRTPSALCVVGMTLVTVSFRPSPPDMASQSQVPMLPFPLSAAPFKPSKMRRVVARGLVGHGTWPSIVKRLHCVVRANHLSEETLVHDSGTKRTDRREAPEEKKFTGEAKKTRAPPLYSSILVRLWQIGRSVTRIRIRGLSGPRCCACRVYSHYSSASGSHSRGHIGYAQPDANSKSCASSLLTRVLNEVLALSVMCIGRYSLERIFASLRL